MRLKKHKSKKMQTQTQPRAQQTIFAPARTNGVQEDKEVGKIFMTRNYDQFKVLTGNRYISEPHVKRLMQSMQEEYLTCPICVNHKMEVIDGQNRVEACKRLGLPVFYYIIKGYGLNQTVRLNATHADWKPDDACDSWIRLGYKDYELYKFYRREFKFDHQTALTLLSGSYDRDLSIKFRRGEFVVKDYKTALDYGEKIREVAKYYKGYKRKNFILALIKCFRNPDYEHAKFIGKLGYLSTRLVHCNDTKQYLQLIEELYNYKSRDKYVRLNTLDEDAANQKREANGKFKKQ